MNEFLKILRAVGCFFWRILNFLVKELFSPDLWRFGITVCRDAKPAYKRFFQKMRGMPAHRRSPIKKGVLLRAGANNYAQFCIRDLAVTVIVIGFIFSVATLGVLVMLGFVSSESLSKIAIWLLLTTGILPIFLLLFLLVPILKYQSDNYFLGYLGERVVAEELDKLGRSQWRIFHSFEGKYGDIDHIIVCPKGVFCVETKTPRKHPGKNEKLIFRDGAIWKDGRRLDNPDPIRQTKGNAGWLYRYLSEKCFDSGKGEKMPFIASVIAFPDWRVEIEHGHYDKDLIPCNPKTIGGVFANREDKLSDKQIEKICAALEKHNRISIEYIP